MAFSKIAGLLLSLLLMFHALRDSSAHVDLGRKLKGDYKLMTAKENTAPVTMVGVIGQDPSAVAEKGERKMVKKKDDNNLSGGEESWKKYKSGARKCSSDDEGKECRMLFEHKENDKDASKESREGHQNQLNNQNKGDNVSEAKTLEAAEQEVMNLMRKDYRSKPRRKPPINNHQPNN